MYKVKVNDSAHSIVSEEKNLLVDGRPFQADILEYSEGRFHIIHNNISYSAEIVEADFQAKTFTVKVNNSIYMLQITDQYDELLKQMGIDATAGKKVNDIKAPMPGMVLNVMVEAGQVIGKGDPIVVLEAMKMENILKSPADGKVKKVMVAKGDKVEKNQVMVNLD